MVITTSVRLQRYVGGLFIHNLMTNKKCLLKSFAVVHTNHYWKQYSLYSTKCINLLFLLSHYLSPSEVIIYLVEFKVVARLLTLPLYFNEYKTRNFYISLETVETFDLRHLRNEFKFNYCLYHMLLRDINQTNCDINHRN